MGGFRSTLSFWRGKVAKVGWDETSNLVEQRPQNQSAVSAIHNSFELHWALRRISRRSVDSLKIENVANVPYGLREIVGRGTSGHVRGILVHRDYAGMFVRAQRQRSAAFQIGSAHANSNGTEFCHPSCTSGRWADSLIVSISGMATKLLVLGIVI
ncbi:hypothetical protein FA15DRAFT_666327 [Coprinopsis marcescibilis]|uniref:Uncharacterized protein n=1 Tax=Coprinopsis marcescibilis TaxID=230819 RepID=A0A5C3L436_COPMA|nr:hypothetical protein FA15DRAFT_666327 [Coprinopsis marcescibilis]